MHAGFGLDSSLLTYLIVVSLLTITPGADTMLVMRNVFGYGQRSGLMTTLGICSGLFFHAVLSALGLSLILVKSAQAFEVVKLCGAAYLVFLGLRSLYEVFWKHDQPVTQANSDLTMVVHKDQNQGLDAYLQGLLNNVLNPKVAVFYLAFLPQFVQVGENVLAKTMLLACIHVVMGLAWLGMLSLLFAKLERWLKSVQWRKAIEGLSGAVLILLGIRLALEKR